jgi:hypothetical protein
MLSEHVTYHGNERAELDKNYVDPYLNMDTFADTYCSPVDGSFLCDVVRISRAQSRCAKKEIHNLPASLLFNFLDSQGGVVVLNSLFLAVFLTISPLILIGKSAFLLATLP